MTAKAPGSWLQIRGCSNAHIWSAAPDNMKAAISPNNEGRVIKALPFILRSP